VRRAGKLTTFVCPLSWNLGASASWKRPALSRSVMGLLYIFSFVTFIQIKLHSLTLTLLTWRIWWAPNNASRWQMGFKLAFKGSKCNFKNLKKEVANFFGVFYKQAERPMSGGSSAINTSTRRRVYIPCSLHSVQSIFRAAYIPCSLHSVQFTFRPVYIPCSLHSVQSTFSAVYIPPSLYSV